MGEIMGMGSTHWPAMIQPDEAKPWPFLRTLARGDASVAVRPLRRDHGVGVAPRPSELPLHDGPHEPGEAVRLQRG